MRQRYAKIGRLRREYVGEEEKNVAPKNVSIATSPNSITQKKQTKKLIKTPSPIKYENLRNGIN